MCENVEKYVFEADWYDKISYTLRNFYLFFFPSDNSIELFDIKTKKLFLKRTKCEELKLKDFYVGAVITVFSRCMKITHFANQITQENLSSKLLKSFVILKSNIINRLGIILKKFDDSNFCISNIKMALLNPKDVKAIKSIQNKLEHVECLFSGPVIALELFKEDGISQGQELSAILEKIDILNDIYVPDNKDNIQKLFFSSKQDIKNAIRNSAKLKNCTCCIIKPHAVQARLVGLIVDDIQKANFIISAIQLFYIDPVNVEEFLEVYKGVFSDHIEMINELQSGPCIVMEISHNNVNFDVVTEFRKFCGPIDPEIAMQIHPNTLRAKYGKNKIQNSVHCSDLIEDGLLEVEYFFKILDTK